VSAQPNVDAVRKIYEAFGRGDIAYILGQLADDVTWESRLEPEVPWSGSYRGSRDVTRFFDAIAGSVDVSSFTPQEFVAEGDTVVSTGTFGCIVRGTGKSALTRWVFIWKFRDGKVQSYEQFHEPSLAAAFRR
jgi:uncharacterized protein